VERFKDPEVKRCKGMFPMDVPKNTRVAINSFMSIGLRAITEEMWEYLKVRSLETYFSFEILTSTVLI
jgi:pre-mRNA-splicing factor CWC22